MKYIHLAIYRILGGTKITKGYVDGKLARTTYDMCNGVWPFNLIPYSAELDMQYDLVDIGPSMAKVAIDNDGKMVYPRPTSNGGQQ